LPQWKKASPSVAAELGDRVTFSDQAGRGTWPSVQASQIEAAHGEIDALVYELYGLREEQIAIVEDTRERG
jgi:hypothetical protein